MEITSMPGIGSLRAAMDLPPPPSPHRQERLGRAVKRTRAQKKMPTVEQKTAEQLRARVEAEIKKPGERVFLEIFAGSARLSSELRNKEIRAIPLDIHEGFDLLREDINRMIMLLITKDLICGVWMALPCHGLGRARRGKPWKSRPVPSRGWPSPIRSSALPWGLPEEDLSPADRRVLAASNALVRVAIQIWTICREHRVPVAIENPFNSFFWLIPEVEGLVMQPGCAFAVLDFCAYGADWKKATKILFLHWVGVNRLVKRCRHIRQGKYLPCLCGFTLQPHRILSGKNPDTKTWWTNTAEPYPWKLAEALADLAVRTLKP